MAGRAFCRQALTKRLMAPSSGEQLSPAVGRTDSGPVDMARYLGAAIRADPGAGPAALRTRLSRTRLLHPFQPVPDPLAQPADGALRTIQLLTDFLGAVTLQAQFHDR